MSLEERLVELEIRYAHQSTQLAALDEVVREFTAKVEELQRQLESLRQSDLEGPGAGPAEKPPHY